MHTEISEGIILMLIIYFKTFKSISFAYRSDIEI